MDICRRRLLAGLLVLAPSLAPAVSFDCAKARTRVETLVCADPELSRLDDALAAAYARALSVSGAKQALREWQRRWLDAEVGACSDAACARRVYSARVSLLGEVAPGPSAEGRWTGRYVRYWNGKPDRHSAELLLIGLRDGRVALQGQAYWVGPNAEQGQVNEGSLDLIARLRRGALVFDAGGACSGELRRAGAGLEVEDNYGCGGINVTFGGDYRRR